MSRRWLLSLLCLSAFFLSLVELTRARGEFKINETTTRILLDRQPAEVVLAVENATGAALNASVEVEILDPRNKSTAKASQIQAIGTGSQRLRLPLPLQYSKLDEKQRTELLWHRLHYRVTENAGNTLAEGIVSLSEITPDFFEIWVMTTELAREGGYYHARVQAVHPISRRPAANVRIDGELTLEGNDDNNTTLRVSKTTDSNGYALLQFVLPQRFPQFPHDLRPSGGQLRVVGKRGPIVATTEGSALVDQFARILATTDKPLYQPGQAIHLRALLFTPSKHSLVNQNAVFKITDPEDTTVFSTIAKTTRFGVANADWSIPENTRLGDYRITVAIEDGEEASETSLDVRISRYDLPNFTVDVETDRSYYLPGQNAEVKVRADYLFGQPVTRGHVRVVREDEREWNYREQKWEIEEGETFEGETDAKGVFNVNINLASDHERINDYDRFRDSTYAAYFTDPTTNRTEQRRFDLRVTKDAIHVYIIQNNEWSTSKALPMRFFVSTFYADGSPALCKVNVELTHESPNKAQNVKRFLASVTTNRYGLAKVSGVRLPSEFDDDSTIDLVFAAVDSKGLHGSHDEQFRFDDGEMVRVETDKALYKIGEPITAVVTSSIPNQMVMLDVLQKSSVIRSQTVKLHKGRGSVVLPYSPDFNGQITIAAYGDFPKWRQNLSLQTVLYPRDPELKVNVRTSQASYRPGEDASVNFSVSSPEGGAAESALGVVVFDKAVEERFRTAQKFGSRYRGVNDTLMRFLDLDEQVAGVTLRDLQRLDTSKPISPEMDLLANVLLTQSRSYYYPNFYSGDEYEHEQDKIFGDLVKQQLKPVREALNARYLKTFEYPTDEQSLHRLLSELKIDGSILRDPWGTSYRPSFSIFQYSDDLTLVSAGADKRFDTGDDFVADRFGWPYFRPKGEAIDRAVNKYYEQTARFVRDSAALRAALSADGLNLDELQDRWGKPYRFEFDVNGTNYVIKVRSSGPDEQFSTNNSYSPDDFVIWTSSIDYFEKTRLAINSALAENSQTTHRFPETEKEFQTILRGSLDSLRDPWRHPYYVTFKTETFPMDRVRMEMAGFSEIRTPHQTITPITQTVRLISLRSNGADGKPETGDDFSVAVFTGVISEELRASAEPQAMARTIAYLGTRGALQGVVTDPMGAMISNASVTAKQSFDSQASRTTTTSEEGKYSFMDLTPGIYELRFEAAGFKIAVVTNVLVNASNITEINVKLEPGAVAETVTVTAAAESLQTDFSVNASQSAVRKNVSVVTRPGGPQLSTPRLREYFPETLLWQPSIETDKQGRAKINFKLADNITTWKMVVVGSTEDGQIGMTEKEIKAFQPFFVDHEPPRFLTDGDEIALPVTVRNYLERPQRVDLDIKPENWFAVMGPMRRQIDVAAGDATRETFALRAISTIKDGKQRITAIGSDESDSIEKKVTVRPDGEELSVTAGDVMTDRSVLELNLPQSMLPNSMRAELKIYPNLMTHVIESVGGIMQRPYGCGEQTISSTYPSLLLLTHYKKSSGDFPQRPKAERYLKEGYDRLLGYRHESGGFTYWGSGQPDLTLTAYALRFLTTASDVISVDPNVIQGAREWLLKQQQADGSWGSQSDVMLTAYVTRVLAQTSPDATEALKWAAAYLAKRAPESSDAYVLAVYALAAIELRDTQRAKTAIEKLRLLTRSDGTAAYWSPHTNTPFHGWGLAGQVETTALVIQALSRYCDSQSVDCDIYKRITSSALLFTLKQKDRHGVWYSTQATINALDAMLMLGRKLSSPVQGTSAETHLFVNGRVAQTIQMPVTDRFNNPVTIDITQLLTLGNNRIELKRPGGLPLASVQGVATFYVPWSDETARNNGRNGLRLNVKFDKTEAGINEEITCNVETDRVGTAGTGMLLAEIGLPPGADVDRGSLQAAMKNDGAINQYDVLPDRVVVYIWPQREGVKFSFRFRPRLGMNAKSAPSTIYDYYNPEARAVVAPVTFKVR